MRRLLPLFLLSCSTVLSAAELPPLGEQAKTWAVSVGHGAVAAAEKRDGRWTFALAGEPFAAGHVAAPAEKVLFEIGSITKVFTGILLADAVHDGKLGLDDPLAQRLPVKFDYPGSGRAVVVLASNAAANPSAWLAARQAGGREPVKRSEISLPASTLDEYAGVYTIDKTARFTLLRRGDGLVARLTGQPFLPVFASAKDELFYKVVDAQLSIHRDAAGKIDQLTLHQNGRDIPAGREAGPAPHIEFPNAAAVAEYVGEYDFGQYQPGARITATAVGDVLQVMLTGQPAFPVFCTGKDRFEYDVVEASLTFERDAAGKVAAVVLHQNGQDMRAPRQ